MSDHNEETLCDVMDETESSKRRSEADSENGSARNKKQKRKNSSSSRIDERISKRRRLIEYYIKNPPKNPDYEEMPAGHPLNNNIYCSVQKQPKKVTKSTKRTQVLVSNMI